MSRRSVDKAARWGRYVGHANGGDQWLVEWTQPPYESYPPTVTRRRLFGDEQRARALVAEVEATAGCQLLRFAHRTLPPFQPVAGFVVEDALTAEDLATARAVTTADVSNFEVLPKLEEDN